MDERPQEVIRRAAQLASQGLSSSAVSLIEPLPAICRGQPALMSNLGSVFSMCNAFEEARNCYEVAANGEPSNPTYLYNLATAQRALGLLTEAEASCDRAIGLNAADAQAYFLRSDLRVQTPERNHVAELEALVQRGALRPEARVLALYALAKEYEDLERWDESFESVKRAADTHRSQLRYDVGDDIRILDRIVQAHTADALGRMAPGHRDAAPVFVVGLPRSGTTLVERIVQSHSGVISVGERIDFAAELSRRIPHTSRSRRPSPDDLVDLSLKVSAAELGASYMARVTPGRDGAGARILDKMPINYLYCGLIHAALPQAKILSVRRHPIDSCYAAYKAYLTGPYAFTYKLDELGTYYQAYQRLIDHWRAILPPDAYQEVWYEDVVRDPARASRQLLQYLDLPWQDSVVAFHASNAASATASAAQIRRPIYSTSIGKWKRLRHQLAPLMSALGSTVPAEDRP